MAENETSVIEFIRVRKLQSAAEGTAFRSFHHDETGHLTTANFWDDSVEFTAIVYYGGLPGPTQARRLRLPSNGEIHKSTLMTKHTPQHVRVGP